jgi:hypothetical protein
MTMKSLELFESETSSAEESGGVGVGCTNLLGVIRSVYESQDDILRGIQHLHCPEGFECDMTYGNGAFWKNLPRPKYCFDVSPQKPEAVQACSMMLPLEPETLNNCVFDPPFLCYVDSGRANASSAGKRAVMSARFGGYWKYQELEDHYRGTLKEAHRVLKPGGKMIFKCQDIIHNHRIHCTHANVIQWAEGFRLKDLFILPAKHRMPLKAASHGRQTQRHARIFHSYFLVLEKPTTRRRVSSGQQAIITKPDIR